MSARTTDRSIDQAGPDAHQGWRRPVEASIVGMGSMRPAADNGSTRPREGARVVLPLRYRPAAAGPLRSCTHRDQRSDESRSANSAWRAVGWS
jgi:hypothetical protein